MSNLHDQLRQYGGYLDTLEAPAAAPRDTHTRAPRWSGLSWFASGAWLRRPGFALALASVVLIVAIGTLVAVTDHGGSGNLAATRAARDTEAGSKAAAGNAPSGTEAPSAAGTPADRSLSSAPDIMITPDATAPGTETRAAVEQQLRAALGACPSVMQAKALARQHTAASFDTAYAVHVDRSHGPCLRLARVDWDRHTVHLERFRSTP